MGVIWHARQVSLNRPVALKMILDGRLATADQIQRFRTEAEAAANLDHPNIVPIYGAGEHEGHHYISMKLVEGQSLADQIQDGKWRITEANKKIVQRSIAELMMKTALAVHHAHQRGVLHRDLKPGNILVDESGEPQVTDFGLAKLTERDYGQTRSQAVMGTPSYMPPEQALGRTKQVTTAADVYSLGAVLYALLTGRPPFKAESDFETLQQVIDREPTPPAALNSNIDRDLETICLRCLDKVAARRYESSAEALAADLKRWLNSEPIVGRRVKLWERSLKWVRRHPITASLIAAITASVLLGWLLVRQSHEQGRFELRSRLVTAENDFETGDARLGLAILAQILRDDPVNPIAAERLVNALRERVFLVPCDHEARTEGSGAFSPNAEFQTPKDDMCWSPGRERLLTGKDTNVIMVVDSNSKTNLFTITNAHARVIRSLCWSRDGQRFVSASADFSAKVWLARTGEPLLSVKHDAAVYHAELSPDGMRLITASRDKTARLWHAADGSPNRGALIGKPMLHENAVITARFNQQDPKGSRVVTASDDDTIRIWDGLTAEPISEPLKLDSMVDDACLSPDNQHVFVFFKTNHARAYRVISENPHPPPNLVLHDSPRAGLDPRLSQRSSVVTDSDDVHLDVSPDGLLIALATNEVAQISDVRNPNKPLAILKHDGRVHLVRFSPDGRRLATTTSTDKARVWDVRTGLPLTEWLPLSARVEEVYFSEDKRWLVTNYGQGWELHLASEPAPAWLSELAEALGGVRITAKRDEEPMAPTVLAAVRKALALNPGIDRLTIWAREFIARETEPDNRLH
jgi:WD40 repeat protein